MLEIRPLHIFGGRVGGGRAAGWREERRNDRGG